jgi:predicted nucleotide-binding protein
MTQASTVLAKLAGIRKAIIATMNENVSRNRSEGNVLTRTNFAPEHVEHYFKQAAAQTEALKVLLPDFYADFQNIETKPAMEMASAKPDAPAPWHFSRAQVERLVRDIDQLFEIRANSELQAPLAEPPRRVFISHGRSKDWLMVQPYIEKDLRLATLELAQEPNLGQTLIEKLVANAERCDSAVIVMTGDDLAENETRVRENVMHEIGYFQGRYGRRAVVLLHEDGVKVPTNLGGIVYVPFPKGSIEAAFHVLQREFTALYKVEA